MQAKRLLNLALVCLLLNACEFEHRLDVTNPYQTARIILVLEQRGINYRLAENGVIHYPWGLEDEIEAARQEAYRQRGKTSAVIARAAQARLIVEQFESTGIDFSARKIENFVLITWDYPGYRAGGETAGPQ